MAKFNINEYKGKFAMHCKTERQAKDFCDFLQSLGGEWCERFNESNYCCLQPHRIYYLDRHFVEAIDYARAANYTILEWSDFMEKPFTKADLKTGDVVKFRNEASAIVLEDFETLITKDGYMLLNDYNDNLTYCNCNSNEWDIMVVRRPKEFYGCQFCACDAGFGELVYTRPKPVEMTLAEVCEALGKEIKIVKEH